MAQSAAQAARAAALSGVSGAKARAAQASGGSSSSSSSTPKTTIYSAPNGKKYSVTTGANGATSFTSQAPGGGTKSFSSLSDAVAAINAGNPSQSSTPTLSMPAGFTADSYAKYFNSQSQDSQNKILAAGYSKPGASVPATTNITPTTPTIPTSQQIVNPLLKGMKFGAAAGTEAEQAKRNFTIAQEFSKMAGSQNGKTEQEKKDAIKEFLTTNLGLNIDMNNSNRQNTVNKLTQKVDEVQGNKAALPEEIQPEVNAAENTEDKSNEITDNQYKDMTENLKNLRTYIDTVADPAMQKTITDRMANITDAQGKIQDAINLMDESKQRIIRLQSNDAIEGIKKQYMAKGLTEEEARSQSQADLNKQVMNERQTLLQAQANTAALNKDLLTWVANAQDTIQVAKNANIQYDTGLESTLTQLKADIINNKYASEKSAFDTYVGSTVMKSFNDMSDIEKKQLLKIADADTLDQNKTVAINTLLGAVSTLLTTRSGAIFKAIQGIKNGTMDYATALQTVVGNNASGGSKPTTPSTTAVPEYS